MLSKSQPTILEVRLLVRKVVKFPANFESRSTLDEFIREEATLVFQATDRCLSGRPARGRQTLKRQPRVRDRSLDADRVRFPSQVQPPSLKKTESFEELIPWLYLKQKFTGNFQEALQALVGERTKGLSSNALSDRKNNDQTNTKSYRIVSFHRSSASIYGPMKSTSTLDLRTMPTENSEFWY